MITEYADLAATDPYDAEPDRRIIWAFTPAMSGREVTVGAISIYLAPSGGSGTQKMRGVVTCIPAGGSLSVSLTEEIILDAMSEEGWYTLRLPEPLTGLRSATWLMGFQTDGPTLVQWRGDPSSTDAPYWDLSYEAGWDDFGNGDPQDGEGPVPVSFADVLPEPKLPLEPDLSYARLGFDSAQKALGNVGPEAPRYRGVVGWYGSYIDVESQGASLGIVQTGGPLEGLLGNRVLVTYGKRSVVVYVHNRLDLDSGEDINLSRRAFQSLAPLATDELICRVEALGPGD